MNLLATAVVTLAGLYLIGLGIAALWRPQATKRFLGSFASSASVHFAELGVRIVVGIGLVLSSGRMLFSSGFFAFGWILIGTSVLLLAVPWQLHHRFAAWSVPIATKRLPLFAFGSLLGGGILLYALFVRPGVV
ncbi:MAG: hypothetical protein ABIZ91_15290 [Gemmatimonadaceae bacterium]